MSQPKIVIARKSTAAEIKQLVGVTEAQAKTAARAAKRVLSKRKQGQTPEP